MLIIGNLGTIKKVLKRFSTINIFLYFLFISLNYIF